MKTYKLLIIIFGLVPFAICAESPVNEDPIKKAIIAFQAKGEMSELDHALALFNTRIKEMNSRQKAEAYISLASELATIFDPSFDTNPPKIFMNISPGIGYDSGISPLDVADPKIRADYERKIAGNKTNAKNARVQTTVRKELDKIARACALMLNSNELSFDEQQRITAAIANGSLPARFKVNASSKEEANKTRHPTGGATVPK